MAAVSVVMPVFNEAQFLPEALESLQAQDFADLEILIADNGSVDATPEICRRVAAKDPRVRVHRSEVNRGAVWNFNRLVPATTGEFFMWAGGHDLWDRQFLSRCLAAMRDDPLVGLVYPRTRWIDGHGAALRDSSDGVGTDALGTVARVNTVLWRTLRCTPIYGLIRRNVLDRTHLFGSAFGSDLVLLAELACYCRFVELPEPLFLRRNNRADESGEAQVARIYESLVPRHGSRRLRFPYCELALALPKMILTTDLSPATRLALLASVGVCVPSRFGPRMLAEVRAAVTGGLAWTPRR